MLEQKPEVAERKIDEFAANAAEWVNAAMGAFEAAKLLFYIENPRLWFSAAILGHHALEMLLKAALIQEGFTVAKGKPWDGFVWGHKTEELAQLLHTKRPEFSINIPDKWDFLFDCPTYLARYDAFFDELRYPTSPLQRVETLGPGAEEIELLAELVHLILPFASRRSAQQQPEV